MMWQVETMVRLKDNQVEGYTVANQVGGSSNLPIDITFKSKDSAVKLAKWLNKKDDWIGRLENIVEYETDINVEEMKKKFERGCK